MISEMVVGFEETYIEVEEGFSKLQLCVNMSYLNNADGAHFDFQLEVSTKKGTACECIYIYFISQYYR